MFTKFVLVGTFNTSFSYGIYFCCLLFGLHFTLSSFISLAISLSSGYLLAKFFVFRSANRIKVIGILRYLGLWMLIYVAHISIIAFFVSVGVSPALAGFCALVCTVPLSYFGQKHFVFNG